MAPAPFMNAYTELTTTICPRLAITDSVAAAAVLTAPVTFTARTWPTSSGLSVRNVAARPRIPALAIATSSRPNTSTVRATAARIDSMSVTSATRGND